VSGKLARLARLLAMSDEKESPGRSLHTQKRQALLLG
jgi:hypothetical protein